MRRVAQIDFFTAGKDFVATVFFIPLSDRRILVHVLDDVSPTDAGVVCTERNFAFLRSVRDDAHFGASEIVVEQILEPHSRDKQEVPRVLTTFFDVFDRAVAVNLSVIFARQTERFVKFLEDSAERQTLRCAIRIVIFQQGEAHHHI